jgi:phospholipid-binding lipoprotein MlaA
VWGAGNGPYFVWPIIGPRYLRDTFGFGFDWASNPTTWLSDPYAEWGLWTMDIVDTRARLLPAERVLEQAAGEDKYVFYREAYRQRRLNLIHDGNPPKPKFFEEDETENDQAMPAKPAADGAAAP